MACQLSAKGYLEKDTSLHSGLNKSKYLIMHRFFNVKLHSKKESICTLRFGLDFDYSLQNQFK